MTIPVATFSPDDVIAAVATPPGVGGVAIVRLSGRGCADLARGLFRPANPDFAGFKPYRLRHGWLTDVAGALVDEVLVAFMPGPGSYTGQDVVEINCHGGPGVSRAVLEAVVAAGARPAGPGEFTYRAFMAGKIDLAQAEAVAEVIAAPSRGALTLASGKLRGLLGRRVGGLRETLEGLRAELCLALDFPEEDVERFASERFAADTASVRRALRELIDGFERGKRWREGALVALIGRVNVGKSSLLNALLGRERAIVSECEGATRDVIEETLDLGGLPVRLADAAGLRDCADPVEREGVRRTRELAAQADVALFMVDGSRPLLPEELEEAASFVGRGLAIVNKSDLPPAAPDPGVALAGLGLPIVRLSARTGQGLGDLADALRERLTGGRTAPVEGEIALNLRQRDAAARAEAELALLEEDLAAGVPFDLLGVRLETACALLAEMTGEIAPEEVLRRVFGSFCIGK